MRGVRGATTVEFNRSEDIGKAVVELLQEMMAGNNLHTEDIGAALFSTTEDLDAMFPAAAARSLPGWEAVPLFDAQQLYVERSLQKCIRVLLLVNTDLKQNEVKHIYQQRAVVLRPDLAK